MAWRRSARLPPGPSPKVGSFRLLTLCFRTIGNRAPESYFPWPLSFVPTSFCRLHRYGRRYSCPARTDRKAARRPGGAARARLSTAGAAGLSHAVASRTAREGRSGVADRLALAAARGGARHRRRAGLSRRDWTAKGMDHPSDGRGGDRGRVPRSRGAWIEAARRAGGVWARSGGTRGGRAVRRRGGGAPFSGGDLQRGDGRGVSRRELGVVGLRLLARAAHVPGDRAVGRADRGADAAGEGRDGDLGGTFASCRGTGVRGRRGAAVAFGGGGDLGGVLPGEVCRSCSRGT